MKINRYICEFCQRQFSREKTITVHLCEQKRRRLSKNDRGVQLGTQAFLRFYEITQPAGKKKTFDDFCTSPYYKAFVKWGNYCVNTNVINTTQFLDWLLKNKHRIDEWASDTKYNEYLIWYLQNEQVEDALTRAVEYSTSWGERNNAKSNDCLRYGNNNEICYAIVSGKISAWVIYNSSSGKEFLSRLSKEQLAIIWDYINPDFWKPKFNKYKSDKEYCEEILSIAGW